MDFMISSSRSDYYYSLTRKQVIRFIITTIILLLVDPKPHILDLDKTGHRESVKCEAFQGTGEKTERSIAISIHHHSSGARINKEIFLHECSHSLPSKKKKKWNQATFRNVHTYSIGGMNFDVSFSSFQVRRNSVSQRITITHFTFEMLPPIIPPFLPPPTKKKSPTNFPLPFRVGAFCLCLFEKSKLSKRGPKTWNSH
jgi:hypothetical protein